MRQLCLAGVIICLSFQALATTDKQGQFLLDLGFPVLNTKYTFKEKDINAQLPEELSDSSGNKQSSKKGSDHFNGSMTLGYYLTEQWALRLTYAMGIELDYDYRDLEGDARDLKYNSPIDMDMAEFDASFYPFNFSNSISPYIEAGMVMHRLKANVDYGEGAHYKSTSCDWDYKVGTGLQWDFGKHFGLRLGYSYYHFIPMEKYYFNMEFRF